MYKTYNFYNNDVLTSHSPVYGILHDHGESLTRLEQYINDGDYFGSLATHLDIIAQTFNKKVEGAGELGQEYKLYLNRIRDELSYLQHHYTIVKKERDDTLHG